MYLKQLDILGFKSFATRTHVRFADGVTAIVGPNGCGKTNVLDALRWVLGEQRPTLLRGSRMEEVIFNGTRDIKPLGMAEVTLSILNDRGLLPTEYHEVMITRRLFRSGDSEYLLNKVPCRLKDIIDLFADTGMGAHSYSVIQQDMIDSVISDKAEERRFLFEEAAGITKYKQRKKAALRKLEATETDFLRLRDIHAEVKTQVTSLYRQQKKAERYQRIADEVRAWEIYLAGKRVREIDSLRQQQQARHDGLVSQRLSLDTELDRLGSDIERRRTSLLDLERELVDLSTRLLTESEKASALERELAVCREKTSHAGELTQRNVTEIASLEARMVALDEQLAENRSGRDRQQEALDAAAAALRDAEAAQAEADRAVFAARAARESSSRQFQELQNQLTSGRTEGAGLREQEAELVAQLKAVADTLAAHDGGQQALLERLDAARSTVNNLIARRQEIERKQNSLTLEIEAQAERIADLAQEIADLTASQEACEARRKLLEDMILHHEGHESGLVAAMQLKEELPGIIGTVADHFVPEAGMEVALEAALGEMAGFLVCRDRGTAEAVIHVVRTTNKGRIGILVPDSGTLTPAIRRPDIPVPNFKGWLETMVTTDSSLHALKEAVLSRVAVFDGGSDPTPILERLPYGFAAVSTDGLLYQRNAITGGSADHFPLFRRREKLQEQAALAQSIGEQLEQTRERRNRATAHLAALRSDSSALTAALENLLEELEAAQHQQSEAEFERRTLTAELDRLHRDRQNLQQRLETIRGRQLSLGLDATALATRQEEIAAAVRRDEEQSAATEQAAAGATEQVAKRQVAVVEQRSLLEQIQSRLQYLADIRSDIEQTIQVRRSEIDRAHEEAERSRNRATEIEQGLAALLSDRTAIEQQQLQLRGEQNILMQEVTTREQVVKEKRSGRDRLGDDIHALEIELTGLNAEASGLVNRLREEFETDIRATEPQRPNDDRPDEQAAAHLADLKDQLRKFGAVNLLALEEYRVAAERESFLSKQMADLTAARDDLQQTITRINQTARELFQTTFEKARQNFRDLFVELFSGGEADIMLVDPNDPLESDIHIIARPSGKKLLPITMLSGGERALTAISLLFSLYLVKPSPFCILDEIDAPLDDANCRRFLKLIRKFSNQTQFIVITHNKITMEAADNLYGVTMEQPGVSRIVAVRFTATEDDSAVSLAPDSDNGEELPAAVRDRLGSPVVIRESSDS